MGVVPRASPQDAQARVLLARAAALPRAAATARNASATQRDRRAQHATSAGEQRARRLGVDGQRRGRVARRAGARVRGEAARARPPRRAPRTAMPPTRPGHAGVVVVGERPANSSAPSAEADAGERGADRARSTTSSGARPALQRTTSTITPISSASRNAGVSRNAKSVSSKSIAGVAGGERAGEQRGQERAQAGGRGEAEPVADVEEERHAAAVASAA